MKSNQERVLTGYSQGASEAPDYNPAQHVNYTTLPTRLARCIFLPFFRGNGCSKEVITMEEMYFSIAGCNQYFGSDFMKEGMKGRINECWKAV